MVIYVSRGYIAALDQRTLNMKTSRKLRLAAALTCSTLAALACEGTLGSPGEDGEIEIAFSEEALQTRADISPSDTNSFILKVTDSDGKSIYDGKYGDSPASIFVSPGKYTVKAYSQEFKVPAFSAPQYGDTQQVTVKSGEKASVKLVVRQINSGVKLNISSAFLKAYPNGSLHLKSDDGKLLYSYSEKRIAYFNPGNVSLMLSDGSTDRTLLTRSLAAQEVLVLDISVSGTSATSGSPGRDITIQADTSRNWVRDSYVLGGGTKGDSPGNAYSVPEAVSQAGKKSVWVYGYIVGGDLSTSKASFQAPFTSKTNFVIAAKSSCTDRSQCMSVQLDGGDIRDALNLADNPGRLRKQVFLKGNIVSSYYGIPGLQGVTEYVLN